MPSASSVAPAGLLAGTGLRPEHLRPGYSNASIGRSCWWAWAAASACSWPGAGACRARRTRASRCASLNLARLETRWCGWSRCARSTRTASKRRRATASSGTCASPRCPSPAKPRPTSRPRCKGQAEGHMLPFVVRDVPSGKVIGTTSYHDIVPAVERLEIGYTWYGRELAAHPRQHHLQAAADDARVRDARRRSWWAGAPTTSTSPASAPSSASAPGRTA